MLTLGSPKRDARYAGAIRRRAHCHSWLSDSLGRYEEDTRRRLLRLLQRTMAWNDLYDHEVLRHVSLSGDPLERLHALPLLGKPELREMVDRVSRRSADVAPFSAETSGSTGVPLRMLFGTEHFVSYFARFLSLLRIDPP